MSLTLSLNPEVEQGLMARARERGVSTDAYLQELVEKDIRATKPAIVSGEEKAREFDFWADSIPETTPLPDEAMSRAAMNPDRW